LLSVFALQKLSNKYRFRKNKAMNRMIHGFYIFCPCARHQAEGVRQPSTVYRS